MIKIETLKVIKSNKRINWCGPSIVSAIANVPVDEVVDLIQQQRIKRGEGYDYRDWVRVKRPVKGTWKHDVDRALLHYGYQLAWSSNRVTSKQNLNQWSKKRKDPSELNLVAAGHHWQLIQDLRYLDNSTVTPVWLTVAPGRRRIVESVYKIVQK